MKADKHEYGIFFLHHNTTPKTTNNLALLKHHNPGVPIIPICQWESDVLPGGYGAQHLSQGAWKRHRPAWFDGHWKTPLRRLLKGVRREYIWRNSDLTVYQWITKHDTPRADRWIIAEWDCFCTTNLKWVYQEVWDADLAAANVHWPAQEAPWHFDRERDRVPGSYKPYLAGLAPLAGIFVREEALREIAWAVQREPEWTQGFSEVRIATVAHALGIELKEITRAKPFLTGNRSFSAHEIQGPGLWHKVKDHDPLVPPRAPTQLA
jgi:hypothetical protein